MTDDIRNSINELKFLSFVLGQMAPEKVNREKYVQMFGVEPDGKALDEMFGTKEDDDG